MTRYELARDKRITISALILEVLSIISFILLVDSILGNQLGVQTIMANHLSWTISSAIVIVIQYALVTIEMIARYREEKCGFTLPLVFLPFGHIVRLLIMLVLAIGVVSLKLIVYFVSVLIQFALLIFQLQKYLGTAHLVDITDICFEPMERFVNATYNLLYFNKIEINGNVFNTVFNGNLTFWCINH